MGLQNSSKTTTGFTPFQLIYALEAILPIEYEIPSFLASCQTTTQYFCQGRILALSISS